MTLREMKMNLEAAGLYYVNGPPQLHCPPATLKAHQAGLPARRCPCCRSKLYQNSVFQAPDRSSTAVIYRCTICENCWRDPDPRWG